MFNALDEKRLLDELAPLEAAGIAIFGLPDEPRLFGARQPNGYIQFIWSGTFATLPSNSVMFHHQQLNHRLRFLIRSGHLRNSTAPVIGSDPPLGAYAIVQRLIKQLVGLRLRPEGRIYLESLTPLGQEESEYEWEITLISPEFMEVDES